MKRTDSGLLIPEYQMIPGGRPFMPPFGAPFQAPFATPGGVVPWYLSGGIALANCIAAYQPKGAANLAASYINLAHPGTNDAAPGTAPTFATATGWIFDGSTQYLKTGINGSATLSAIIRFSGGPGASYKDIVGSTDSVVGSFEIVPNYTTSKLLGEHGSVIGQTAPGMTVGNAALAPTGIYRNGIIDTIITANWTGVTAYPLFVGALNSANISALNFWSGNVQAVAIYNIDIASYVLAVNNAMAAL